ncbi:MAG: ABC transporter permease, partial [Vulcanococcus sp.]
IRAAYAGQFSLSAVVLEAPYGSVTAAGCLGVLAALALGLFLLIRPLLDRKLA